MDALDEWSPSLSDQQKNQLLKDNFNKLNQYVQFTGFDLLASISTTTKQNATGSYVEVPSLTSSFTSSGGLVILGGVLFGQTANGNPVYYQLFIDDIAQQELSTVISSANFYTGPLPVFWAGVMAAGKHTAKFKIKGSGYMNSGSTQQSNYYVMEFRKG